MTPAARLEAAIAILDGLGATGQPADRFLREWFRSRRYAGSKDRAAVAERVFAVLRHWYSLSWRMTSEAPRALVVASLLAEGKTTDEIAALFDGSPYGPAPLTDAERAAILAPAREDAPLHVKGEFPPFLEDELRRAFPSHPVLLDEMLALQDRAPIDLRTNPLKTTRAALKAALRAQGFAVEPTPWSPWGLRLPPGEGSAKLSATDEFRNGAFEFQDEAAQLAALLCNVKPGLSVLDFAAGAGGKSLALAAVMHNTGEIVAHDADAARLAMLAPRAQRAGATIIQALSSPVYGGGGLRAERANRRGEPHDLVLLDSPCSGTGTWRRQPELRVRLTPERLAALTALQDRLLAEAAAFVKPGGRLVYATCSILPCESEDRVVLFLSQHADFAIVPAAAVWREATGREPPPGLTQFFTATPRRTGTDGFFTAILERRGGWPAGAG